MLTIEEQVALLAGADMWTVPPAGDPPVGPLKMSDGPSGARGAEFTGGPPSVCFPCGTALGATWDPALVREVGAALGDETRAKGAHVLLGPTVNLHRHPLGGRNFECFSEDPFLSAALAAAYVEGVQSRGVAACPKHLVANDSEFERFTISSEVPERVLREVYLLPFEAALTRAGAWTVMSAYNRLGGVYCSEHPWLLTTLLRDDWGWDGVVVSDWFGTHSTEAALAAGLDIEMPGPPLHRGPKLLAAVKAGTADGGRVAESARRVELLADRTGARGGSVAEERYEDVPARHALARRAAAEAIVLLRNAPVDGAPVLPLAPGTLRRLAVLGPNADRLHAQGGGSAEVTPPYVVTPLEGLAAALGPGVSIEHVPGCAPATPAAPLDLRRVRTPDGAPGIRVRYFANRELAGDPVAERTVPRSDLSWLGGLVPEVDVEPGGWSARVDTRLRVTTGGRHHLHVRGPGRIRLTVDDVVALDEESEPPGGRRPPVAVELVEGEEHDIALDLVPPAEPPGLARLGLRLEDPDDAAQLDRAVAAASAADATVVVVGLDARHQTEGRDRTDFALPAPQVELIRRVAAVAPRTAVVVNAASPVDLEWADAVPAVVVLWAPGHEGGGALADVLLGAADPGGRLPTTFPRRLDDVASHRWWPGSDGRAEYGEGLLVGHRHHDANGSEPRYPFGHGLSYAAFEVGALTLEAAEVAPGEPVRAAVDVTNTADRPGTTVVQAYLADIDAPVPRPPRELKAFAKVRLAAGERRRVELTLSPRDLSYWDDGGWRADPGEFELLVGLSAADVRRRARFRLLP